MNQGLRREIASLEECLAEVQQEATSENVSLVGAQDARELVSHASDHNVYDSLPVGSQSVEEGGESVPSPPPVMSAEEQTASAPIMGVEQPLSGPMNMSGSTTSVEGSSGHPTSPSMLQQVTQLLQAQRDMMAAQIEAIATNSVPPLKLFSGDDVHTEDGSFDRWLEQFDDRAKAANWNENQKLFQLKSHLEKTAAHVVRMMPSEERVKYTSVVSTLRKRFQSLDIDRGAEGTGVLPTDARQAVGRGTTCGHAEASSKGFSREQCKRVSPHAKGTVLPSPLTEVATQTWRPKN